MSDELESEVINEDSEKNSDNETKKIENEKKGVFSTIKTGLNKAAAAGKFAYKHTLGKGIDKIQQEIEKGKLNKEVNEFFKSKSETFFIDGKTIYGIKKSENKELIFRCADEKEIIAGTEIKFDALIFEIIDVDRKNPFNFTYNDEEHLLPCFKALYNIKEKPQSPNTIINQVTNTVNIGDNATIGDINQNVQIKNEKLYEIEKLIKDSKPGLLNIKKKNQAVEMFGQFKNCIINEQKDTSLFDKFIKILGVIAPLAIPIVSTLI